MMREYIEELGMKKALKPELQQCFDKGFQKGFQEGIRIRTAERATRQLQIKFSAVAKPYLDRVLSATQTELDLICQRLLFADSIEEVFAES